MIHFKIEELLKTVKLLKKKKKKKKKEKREKNHKRYKTGFIYFLTFSKNYWYNIVKPKDIQTEDVKDPTSSSKKRPNKNN